MTKILDNLKVVGTGTSSNALSISNGNVTSTGVIYANSGIDAGNILYVGASASLIKTQNTGGTVSSVWNRSYINWNNPYGTSSITFNDSIALEYKSPNPHVFIDYNSNQSIFKLSPSDKLMVVGSTNSTISNTIVNSSILRFDSQYWTGISVTVSVPLQVKIDNLSGDHRFTIGSMFNILNDEFIGIGTIIPTTNFQVNGSLRFVTGNQGSNKILSSDSLGNADWIINSYVSGSGNGTINYLSKWGTTSSLVDSRVFDNGSSIGIGYGFTLSRSGEVVQSNGTYSTYNGTAQISNLVSRSQTTDSTQTELFLDELSSVISISDNRLLGFKITAAAIQTDGTASGVGDSMIKVFKGAIKNLFGTTSIVGSVIEETLANDPGANSWTVLVDANVSSDYLRIRVTGEDYKNIRWLAKTELVEISYADLGSFGPGFTPGFF